MDDVGTHPPRPVLCALLVVLIALVSLVGVRLGGQARQDSSPCDPTPTDHSSVILRELGVAGPPFASAQIHDALPCNWSGEDPPPPSGRTGTDVIYLSPLDAHTRGVADAIITRNPRPGVTFQLRPGKQPLFRAQAQLDRLTAHSHSTQYSYTIRSDGSLTRAATPCWSPYYPDSPPVGEVISRPGSATTMIVCGG